MVTDARTLFDGTAAVIKGANCRGGPPANRSKLNDDIKFRHFFLHN